MPSASMIKTRLTFIVWQEENNDKNKLNLFIEVKKYFYEKISV